MGGNFGPVHLVNSPQAKAWAARLVGNVCYSKKGKRKGKRK